MPAAAAATTPATLVPTPVFDSAALLGDWRFRAETGERDIEGLLRFRLEGDALVGLYVSPNGAATRLTNLEVSGNRIAWELVTPRTTWNLRGTFTEDWMNGTFQTTARTVQWTATKQSGPAATPPTITPGG
ncbi:MAG: hypothetical protein ABR576_16560 [Thermoanaerobaculia bacterium]